MVPNDSIKPISYFKTHASEIVRDVWDNQKTMIITQNGEAKAILQDIKLYEQTQESLSMLKLLSLSTKSHNEGKFKPVEESFNDIRSKINNGI